MTRRRLPVVLGGAVAVAAAVAAAVIVAWGGSESADGRVASPLADCAALTSAPGQEPSSAPAGGAGAAPPLPNDLALPCVTGGEPVVVGELAGPAVVNAWATWCLPCREELPVLQRLADRAGEELHVVGVVTEDTRERAVSFASDTGLTFPSLLDTDRELGLPGVPATLFVAADGTVQHRHLGAPFDDARLAALVEEHLGVAVPPGASASGEGNGG